MHSGFLGVFSVTCGNIIVELLEIGCFGPVDLPLQTLLSSAFGSFQVYLRSKRFTADVRAFTPSTFNKGVFSLLHHPDLTLKAHDIRMMEGWLVPETERASDLSTVEGRRRYWEGPVLRFRRPI